MAEAGAAECLADEAMAGVWGDRLFGAAQADLVAAVLAVEVQVAVAVLVVLVVEVSAVADQVVAGS